MSKHSTTLTAERVRFLFNYDPVMGTLTWKNPTAYTSHVGQAAGTKALNGRVYVAVDRVRHLAHRIAWLHHFGSLPDDNISAENGDYTDLRIANLTAQTFSETASKGARRSNSSGIRGVSWDKTKRKWQATITRNYKQEHLGRFDTQEEAEVAYREARVNSPKPVDSHEERTLRAAAVARRVALRNLWKKTLRDAGGIVGWLSYEAFCADIGDHATKDFILVAKRADEVIGPSNHTWREPPSGWNQMTPEGRTAYNRMHRAQNPDIYKDRVLRGNFGISLEQYREMLLAQNGVCALCKKPETETRHGKVRALAVDHCHATQRVRALLCGFCNKGIGYFRDEPELIRAAADYVEFHQKAAGLASNVIPLKRKDQQ